MKKMIKFPSIEQYRNIIQSVIHATQYRGQDADDNPIIDESAELPLFRLVVQLNFMERMRESVTIKQMGFGHNQERIL